MASTHTPAKIPKNFLFILFLLDESPAWGENADADADSVAG
jgi:hypothetical protein